MTDQTEKKHRQAIVLQLARQGRAEAETRMPLSKSTLHDLFDTLDERLGESECDRTLRYTRAFLQERRLPEEPVTVWLKEYDGGCDCEVLANVEETWGESIGSVKA